MSVERRDSVKRPASAAQPGTVWDEAAPMAKPIVISKHRVVEAFRLVKANADSAGVDKQSIAAFEKNLKDNLYRLWNRMSSGSYVPPLVRAVPIPKKTGGERNVRPRSSHVGITAPPSRLKPYWTRLSVDAEQPPDDHALSARDFARARNLGGSYSSYGGGGS